MNLLWFPYLTFQNLLVLCDIFITKIPAVLPAQCHEEILPEPIYYTAKSLLKIGNLSRGLSGDPLVTLPVICFPTDAAFLADSPSSSSQCIHPGK